MSNTDSGHFVPLQRALYRLLYLYNMFRKHITKENDVNYTNYSKVFHFEISLLNVPEEFSIKWFW